MFSVVANLADESDYLAHWEGGDYERLEDAITKWELWLPPLNDVMEAAIENDAIDGKEYEYQLQVGVWDEDGRDVEFWNREFTVKDHEFLRSAYN